MLSIDPSHGNGHTKESGYGFDWIREVFAVLREALVGTAGSCGISVRHSAVVNDNQKRSSIAAWDGEAFGAIIDLMYWEFSNRAAEICGPTVTAMPASRNAAKPLPLTLGFGSAVQQTTLFT